MRDRLKGAALVALLSGLMAVTGTTVWAAPRRHMHHAGGAGSRISHVLLISVDGLHQSDLSWYIEHHPHSALARLSDGGLEYTNARTPIPSDSFPGMVAQVTGGDPKVTGVYYDASYNHNLLPPNGSCTPGQTTGLGTPVNYDESIDVNQNSIDAGQGLTGLPDSILNMTSNPRSVIAPAQLPLDPARNCERVYPHQYLQVNTIFNVARAHNLRTAWSDKHPAYDILQGPSGDGIQDLFTPEINSLAFHPGGTTAYGGDWTSDNAATRQYDSYKVQAILNEVDGFDHTGKGSKVGVPAIFGMNFQTISTAEKLPRSEATISGPQLNGGYIAGTRRPGPLLSDALDWLNGKIEAIEGEIQKRGLANSTAIILSAKHGQSPQDPHALVRVDDGPIIDGINNGWRSHLGNPSAPDLVAAATDDDAIQMWLSDRSQSATNFVADWLMSHSATGTTYNATDPTKAGPTRTLQHSGLAEAFAGDDAASYFGVPSSDPRHPDVWGVVQHGVVYTGGVKKIAEHGGADNEDRAVPLLVFAPGAGHRGEVRKPVETTQIAPTILQLLGLSPASLQAVQQERTQVLPRLHR